MPDLRLAEDAGGIGGRGVGSCEGITWLGSSRLTMGAHLHRPLATQVQSSQRRATRTIDGNFEEYRR